MDSKQITLSKLQLAILSTFQINDIDSFQEKGSVYNKLITSQDTHINKSSSEVIFENIDTLCSLGFIDNKPRDGTSRLLFGPTPKARTFLERLKESD